MADLVLSNICKSFEGIKALDNVTFEANQGEVHALLGENGAGKSTVIKCLGGCISIDSGEMTLHGKKLNISNPKDAMEAGVGIVFQELSLIPTLNVADNIYLGIKVNNKISLTRRKTIYKMTQELFKKYDIEDIKPDAKVDTLSLSHRQIVEIAKVLSRDPKVVVFDEATSALTQNRVQWLLKIARKLAQDGKTVIFISHRMAEIKDLCDVVTVFRNGQNVGTRKIGEVTSDELVTMMLGRKVTGYYPEKISYKQDKTMLETKKLSLKNRSIHDIDLNLKYGEVVGVGGLAGQGQSSLFLSLYGVLHADGEQYIEGKKVKLRSPEQSLKHGVALVPEDRSTQGLVLPLSIKNNILMSVISRLTRFGIIQKKATDMLVENSVHTLDIKAGDLDVPVMSLSGGNQQKVVLSKLLLTEPKVMLLYDTTRGVDIGTKKEMFVLVRKLAAKGNTILFYSTDMEELVNVCDRALVMYEGGIVADLENEFLTQENILRASIGEKVK